MKPILLSLALLFAGCNKEIPTTQEKPIATAWMATTGKSMLPAFPEQALIEVLIGFPFDELKAGDTVVFWDYRRGYALTHHRLVHKQGRAWMAKGDNNPNVDDSWVTKDNFIAKSTGKHSAIIVFPPLLP